jgi:hypothetical protein
VVTPRALPQAVSSPPLPSAPPPNEAPLPYEERVQVSAERAIADALDHVVAFTGRQAAQAPAEAAVDPLRAFHTAPGVVATDDFRSDFSVRASAPRHTAVVIDGVPAPWMQHAVYGAGDSASLSMFGAHVVERAELHAGAGPLRDVDRLAAQVDVTLREGARDRLTTTASLSSAAGTVVAEGPLGRERGSWLVAARRSIYDWPTRSLRREMPGTSFGYRDVQAKLALDVNAAHRLTLSIIDGHSRGDEGDELLPRARHLDRPRRRGSVRRTPAMESWSRCR